MAIARGMAGELAKLLSATASARLFAGRPSQDRLLQPSLRRWLGLPIEELPGNVCNYISSAEASADSSAAQLAGLCPPPEVFSGQRTVGLISPHGDGRLTRRRAEFIPLADDADGWQGVLVVADPRDCPADAGGSAGNLAADQSDESLVLHERLQQFHHELRQHGRMDRLIGDSPAMVRVRAQVQLAAVGTATVLVVGPVGSGRQHVARAVHYARRDAEAGSLVPLSCALLGTEILRSTLSALFGRDGEKRQSAGTLLLGDVHRLPAEVQTELAGYLKDISSPPRIVATSIAPLDELAAQNGFRLDLACAFSTVVIHLPPLSERREDIPLLARLSWRSKTLAGRNSSAASRPRPSINWPPIGGRPTSINWPRPFARRTRRRKEIKSCQPICPNESSWPRPPGVLAPRTATDRFGKLSGADRARIDRTGIAAGQGEQDQSGSTTQPDSPAAVSTHDPTRFRIRGRHDKRRRVGCRAVTRLVG